MFSFEEHEEKKITLVSGDGVSSTGGPWPTVAQTANKVTNAPIDDDQKALSEESDLEVKVVSKKEDEKIPTETQGDKIRKLLDIDTNDDNQENNADKEGEMSVTETGMVLWQEPVSSHVS